MDQQKLTERQQGINAYQSVQPAVAKLMKHPKNDPWPLITLNHIINGNRKQDLDGQYKENGKEYEQGIGIDGLKNIKVLEEYGFPKKAPEYTPLVKEAINFAINTSKLGAELKAEKTVTELDVIRAQLVSKKK